MERRSPSPLPSCHPIVDLASSSTDGDMALEVHGLYHESMDIEDIIRIDSQFHEGANDELEGSKESGGIGEEVVEPYVGMEFASLDIAYDFYNHYGLRTGFGIRKSKSWKARSDKGKILAKFFVCNKEGFRQVKEGDPEMYFDLRHLCNFVIEESSSSLTLYKLAHSHISDLVAEIKKEKEGYESGEPNVLTASSIPFFTNSDNYSNITIHDPREPARTKGRPKAVTRIQCGEEISQKEEEKQSRHCKSCGVAGHNIRTCPIERIKVEVAAKAIAEAAVKN